MYRVPNAGSENAGDVYKRQGQQAQISYDTDGNPVNIASGEGTAGTYRYDEKGRISEDVYKRQHFRRIIR